MQRAEGELVDRYWSPPPGLQLWLQLTHEIENKAYSAKKVAAEKQLQAARDAVSVHINWFAKYRSYFYRLALSSYTFFPDYLRVSLIYAPLKGGKKIRLSPTCQQLKEVDLL